MFYYGIQHSPSPPTRYVAASNALLFARAAHCLRHTTICSCAVLPRGSLFKNTRIAFKLIKHPISNGSVFGETWLRLALSTNQSKQSSSARSSRFQKANICRLAIGKCVFILRLCHFHYPAAVYRSTGIRIAVTASPNAILNIKMLRQVTEWPVQRQQMMHSGIWMGEG